MTPDTLATTAAPSMPLAPWIILIVLVVLGLFLTKESVTHPRVSMGITIGMLIWSLVSVRSDLGLTPITALCWLIGVSVAALALCGLGWPRGVQWDATRRRLIVPGSWGPLIAFIGIFLTRFAMGAATAMKLPVLHTAWFAPLAAMCLGACSGVFLARCIVMQRAVPGSASTLAPPTGIPPATNRP